MIIFSPRSRAIATAISVAAATCSMAAPAMAAVTSTTTCGSAVISGDVPGDLLVPAGTECQVNTGSIGGSIHVEAGGRLDVLIGQVGGDVDAGTLSYVLISDQSTITGTVHLDNAHLFSANNSILVGGVTGTMSSPVTEEEDETDLSFVQSTIDGDVSIGLTAHYRYATVQESTFAGTVTISGATLRFTHSTVDGRAIFDDALTDNGLYEGIGTPSYLCDVDFRANLTLRQSPGSVLLGGGKGCAGVQPVTVRGALLILDNTGSVHISARIGGDLVCRRNTHHPIAGHPTSRHLRVVVGGRAIGQCAALTGA